jgi:hypothetical protein
MLHAVAPVGALQSRTRFRYLCSHVYALEGLPVTDAHVVRALPYDRVEEVEEALARGLPDYLEEWPTDGVELPLAWLEVRAVRGERA